MVPSAPADTEGAVLMVSTIASDALLQVPVPIAVRVRVTVPAVISAALGV